MAKFFVKNGGCMEEVDSHVQIDPRDIITWIKYKVEGRTSERSRISESSWISAVNSRNSMIIIDKRNRSSCSAMKKLEAMIDICHIIGIWHDIVLEEYNNGLPDNKKHSDFGYLFNQTYKNQKVQNRFDGIIKRHGMEYTEDSNMKYKYIRILFGYKKLRNDKVHKKELQRGPTASKLNSQLQDAIRFLNIAPEQPEVFRKRLKNARDAFIGGAKLIFYFM
ncbi:hypothetical protein C1645_742881 [Glomus cerebriforme]|uniref:Uncharacterized protein n=1 Tax=Glomus cerebriforme TaxID=658196 RepID=A0A397SDV1_9GLOM|nr:hypothetical protein C1645_742881 [Glomus cerebriforme]